MIVMTIAQFDICNNYEIELNNYKNVSNVKKNLNVIMFLPIIVSHVFHLV